MLSCELTRKTKKSYEFKHRSLGVLSSVHKCCIFTVGRKEALKMWLESKYPLKYNNCQRWWFLIEITPQKNEFTMKIHPVSLENIKALNKLNGRYPCGLNVFLLFFLNFVLSEQHFPHKNRQKKKMFRHLDIAGPWTQRLKIRRSIIQISYSLLAQHFFNLCLAVQISRQTKG